MIRVKISNFIKNNKNKIQDFLTKLIIVAIVVFIATIMLSGFRSTSDNKQDTSKKVYNPTKTVIKGSNISEKQYETDSNIVNKFLEHCNNGQVEEAYNILIDDCKAELYPTIDYFKNNYYNNIFSEKRECNLQSWISTSKYNIYKIRYTNNMLATGTYNKNNIYEDYITLDKNSNTQKISIGDFITCEECNITTKTAELHATVVKKKIYISDEEYEIQIENNTNKTILLDTLDSNTKIKLIGSSGEEYGAYTNKIFLMNLRINPGETKNITIRFNKNLSSDIKSEKIKFSNVIKDYYEYIQNKENYNDITNIAINLED